MSGIVFKLDVLRYMTSWSEVMVFMWREEMLKYNIVDTNALSNSLTYGATGDTSHAKVNFGFHKYGIYVNAGVNKYHKSGNDAIKARPWLNKKLYSSIMKIRETFAQESMDMFVREMRDAVL